MKIYISGKIAGDPDYKGKFARAAAQLERLGATVINPATAPEGLTKLDYMRICFAEMEAVDYVVFLPDWSSSDGAKLERAWCDYVGVPTANWDAFRVDMLVRKSHGCTFRELLALEHPDKVDARFIGGCAGCPEEYGYEPGNGTECLCEKNWNTKKSVPQICTECWDRIVPGSEAVRNDELQRRGGHLHRQDGLLGMTDKGGEDVGLETGGG